MSPYVYIMYRLFLFFLFVSIAVSCNDHSLGDPVHRVYIDYPAAYVVNGGSSNLSVIRLSDLAYTEAIDLDQAPFPHHISLSPDRTLLAVAITGTDLSGGHGGHGGHGVMVEGQRIQIIDPVQGQIHHEIPVNGLPHNAIFHPSGTELWVPVGDTLQGYIQVYSTQGWNLIHTIPVGKAPSEVTFSHDGLRVFVANTRDGTVSVIDPEGKNVLLTVATGKDPVGAWPASNGRMYVDNEGDRTVTELDANSGAVLSTIHLGFIPGYVAYHSGQEELWITDVTNGGVAWFRQILGVWVQRGSLSTGDDAHAIAFTPDGSRALVTNQGANTVSVIEVALHEVVRTILVGDKPNGIVIRE